MVIKYSVPVVKSQIKHDECRLCNVDVVLRYMYYDVFLCTVLSVISILLHYYSLCFYSAKSSLECFLEICQFGTCSSQHPENVWSVLLTHDLILRKSEMSFFSV